MNTKRNVIAGSIVLAFAAAAALAGSHLPGAAHAGQAAPAAMAPEARNVPPPSPAQVADARMLSRTFTQVAAQVSPAVVRLSTSKTVDVSMLNPFRGTPFEDFFGSPGDAPSQRQRGTGSGVVVDKAGYILTNNHVVEGADEVKVSFIDGKTVNGKVVGTDKRSDLAVVKVDGVDVVPAPLGDSENLQVGEWVIAIGNPFGLDHTVTVGVLSAKNRSVLGGGRYEDFLQTDASINPGNSGGPLVNLDGQVIGINTAIAGIGTGIGFAVPSSMAAPITEQLIKNGKVRRAYVGVLLQDITPELHKSLGRGAPEKGALISEAQTNSPGAKAGLKAGDVVTQVDGRPVAESKDVQRSVLARRPGDTVNLTVWRGGRTQEFTVRTQELPSDDDEAEASHQSRRGRDTLGATFQSVTPEIAERLNLERGERGALIANVRPGSVAAEAGMRDGDVIIDIDGKTVRGAEDAVRFLSTARDGGHLVRVKRSGGALFLVVPSGK